MGMVLFTVSNTSFSHRRFCFCTNFSLCQRSPSFSGTIVSAMSQRPSFLCHTNIYSQPASALRLCAHNPGSVLLFLAESIFLLANPSPSCLWLLPHANVKGSHRTVKWNRMGTETPPSQSNAACRLRLKPKGFFPTCCPSAQRNEQCANTIEIEILRCKRLLMTGFGILMRLCLQCSSCLEYCWKIFLIQRKKSASLDSLCLTKCRLLSSNSKTIFKNILGAVQGLKRTAKLLYSNISLSQKRFCRVPYHLCICFPHFWTDILSDLSDVHKRAQKNFL